MSQSNAHDDKGQNDEALSSYAKAIEVNPQHSPAYNNRALVYMKQENLDLALADLNKAILINPWK